MASGESSTICGATLGWNCTPATIDSVESWFNRA